MCYESELFLATGAATKLISSWVGIGLRWGIPKVFREYVERDPSIYEEWSHLSFGLRLMAGSMGMPFLPTASLLGSDLLERTACPADPLPVHRPAAGGGAGARARRGPHPRPDRRRGRQRPDRGPGLHGRRIARAAKTVIITAEEIVPSEAIVRQPTAR